MTEKKRRGFSAMDDDKKREIARKGGIAGVVPVGNKIATHRRLPKGISSRPAARCSTSCRRSGGGHIGHTPPRARPAPLCGSEPHALEHAVGPGRWYLHTYGGRLG